MRVVHGLGVDALAGLGVVLHLDRQIAAHRLDEDLVGDVDVGMIAEHVIFAGGGHPVEVVGRREDVVALAAVVDVAGRQAGDHLPAKNPEVIRSIADAKDGQQLVVGAAEGEDPGLPVVLVELFELGDELRVAEQPRLVLGGAEVPALGALDHAVQ